MLDEHGNLMIEGDHVDLSYCDTDEWTGYTPKRSIAAQIFSLGDPASGPFVALGAVQDVPDEQLDWAHTVDPMHFHGSDQFRLILGGEWNVAREPMNEGQFGFQEAGRVYQEHPGPGGSAWTFLVYGDRRGMPATLTLEEDRAKLAGQSEIAGNGIAGAGEYPHPAGPKGIPAISTSAGGTVKGYLRGSFSDTTAWRAVGDDGRILAGVWGDATSGPVVYLLASGADRVVVPACSYATQAVLIVSKGSCRVGDDEYLAGALRVQAADRPLAPVVSGPDGLEGALMIADRRSSAVLADPANAAASEWKDTTDALLAELAAAVAPSGGQD
jgi:hypothetical protein